VPTLTATTVERRSRAVIGFGGDSGDGLATFPNHPAGTRAPHGPVAGETWTVANGAVETPRAGRGTAADRPKEARS
jgi:hypothetical protein